MKKLLTLCLLLLAGIIAPGLSLAQSVIQVTADITTNTTWTRNNVYILTGYRYIKDGATLTIEPGTMIKGDKATKGTLIVSKTGKIYANGTATEPIVFTSNQPVGQRTYGDWGGLVMLGNATINVAGGSGLIEGGLLGADATYGGTNDDDSSGVLRYVRIEFPGIAYQPNNEINGLTMGGVGRKTVIENVQVSYSGDDSYEWFGGTVNGRNLIAIRGWDDDFDVDFGFRGKVQFGLVVRDGAVADQSQSNGFESDNDGSGSSNTPFTAPLFSNVTFIGPRENAATPNSLYRRAMHLRRNSRTSVYNSVFTGYPIGLHLDGTASQGAATNNDLQLENLVFANMGVTFEQTSGANTWSGMAAYFNDATRANEVYAATSSLGLASGYNSLTNPSLLPASGSILLGGASFSNARLSTDPFWTPTTFRGAFGTSDWTAGWANFNPNMTSYELTTLPTAVVQVTADITTNTTWTRNNVYVLNGYRYIKDGATLTIEPGTMIKGDKASKGTLIVSKTGKIYANGTATEPIVFTSNQLSGQRAYGDWGGIVMLGNATINVAGGSGLIEGGLLGADATYGGTNDDDSSGVLRYVRIEFPGIAYQPNNEINGLTMGGVGRKTVIENVQVSYSGDDSYEWFGGTVNGRNLIAIRGWDDDFDVDFGFRGKVQFGLVIRDGAVADQSQSNGFESDNDGSGSSNTPFTAPLFSNVTFIGPRENAATPNSLYRRAMHLRRNSRTSVYNSVFTGYPIGLHLDGTASQGAATNNDLQLENLVFANMGVTFEQTSGANTWSGMAAYFNDASRANEVYASTSSLGLASGYNSLTNPSLLPASGSILLGGASFSNARLSSDPFWTPTTFRGAFGTSDWTAGWANFNPNGTDYSVPAVVQVTSDITTNTFWSKENIYVLNGYRYVKDGATLTIEAGTMIKGDKASKGTLIVSKTGKLVANGTSCDPIVFTSSEPAGARTYGDWGGIVMLGNATINVAGGSGLIEGGLLGADATYGGTNDDDSSGVLRYVRIEFPGIAYQPNNEINGLTMGGVGRKTVIENVQVSYSGDDSYEWFGGTVNGRNLIAVRGWDDDFDVDFGFRGKVQFGLVVRDGAVADQSQSNGFESDNDGSGSSNTPFTAPLFSNVTFIGPRENAATPNSLYRRAMHLRRNSRTSVYNSVFTGYPIGLHIDATASQGAATNNDLQLENLVFANMGVTFEQTSGANTWSGIAAYFNDASRANEVYASTSSLGLASGYNSLTNPSLLPASGSILLGGASFSNPRLSTDPFWTPTTFRGAFGTSDWTAGWANFNPQASDYSLESMAFQRHAPKGLTLTANSSTGSVEANFNPASGASQNWIRYRASGTASWTDLVVANRPFAFAPGAGNWEVQAASKVGNRIFWSCPAYVTVLPSGVVNRNVKFRVNMTGLTVSPSGVYVVGNLQGFNAGVTRLMPTAANPNIYEKDTVVYNGFVMNYKFANGDQLADAETVPSACSINDATHGNLRSVTVLSDLVLDAVLYGQCGTQFVGRVAGTFTYDNTAATAMTNSTVNLSGASTGSQGTAASSAFGFDRVVNGNFSLSFSTNKPWGGVSASDALIVNRHVVGSTALAGIRLRAADVNNSSTVTSGDALLINRRVAGLLATFTAGNWAYSNNTGVVNNDTVVVNAKAVCFGDVNASYVPNTAFRFGSYTPAVNGLVATEGHVYEFPIAVDQAANVGAVTLFVNLPAGMEVLDVVSAQELPSHEVSFKQEGRRLNIAWFTMNPWNLNENEAIVKIIARGQVEGTVEIAQAEVANSNAETLVGLSLRAPRLVERAQGLFVYPNPTVGQAQLQLMESLMDQVQVVDAIGKVVYSVSPAAHQHTLDLSTLPSGIYHVEVRSGERLLTEKVVIR